MCERGGAAGTFIAHNSQAVILVEPMFEVIFDVGFLNLRHDRQELIQLREACVLGYLPLVRVIKLQRYVVAKMFLCQLNRAHAYHIIVPLPMKELNSTAIKM